MTAIQSITIGNNTLTQKRNNIKLIDVGLGNLTTKGTYQIDLSPYLEAGKSYLLTFEGVVVSNTSGVTVRFANSIFGDVAVATCIARTQTAYNPTFPIGTTRIMTINVDNNNDYNYIRLMNAIELV